MSKEQLPWDALYPEEQAERGLKALQRIKELGDSRSPVVQFKMASIALQALSGAPRDR